MCWQTQCSVAVTVFPRLLNVEWRVCSVLTRRESGHARRSPREEAVRGRHCYQTHLARGSQVQRQPKEALRDPRPPGARSGGGWSVISSYQLLANN